MTKTNSVVVKTILALLFLGCLLKFEYGYYLLVRFLGMIGFVILAYEQYKKNQFYLVLWLASAILINPIFKIALGRTIWNVIDIIWAILLITSIFGRDKKITDKQLH
jgi:hypothetical protein